MIDATAPPAEVQGPSALGGGWRRMWHLTWVIAVTDYRMTYFGSALGYFWTLMRPLFTFLVLFFVFTRILGVGVDVPFYGQIVLMNVMLWFFFTDVTGSSVTAVSDRESLVRKVHFPRIVIPLSVTTTGLFNLAGNIVAVFVFLIASGVEPRVSWLLFPVLLLPLIIFTMGVAMILSSLYVRFRDVKPIWGVLQLALFYGTPVLYLMNMVPIPARPYLGSNPIAAILTEIRRVVIDPSAPSAAAAFPFEWGIAIPIAIFVAVPAIGFWYFNREAPRIAEEL